MQYKNQNEEDENTYKKSSKFSPTDQYVYNEFCNSLQELKNQKISTEEEQILLDEIKKGKNVNENTKKLLFNKLNILKRYIDANYVYQDNQNYTLEDYIVSGIEGIILAIKNYKGSCNLYQYIYRQIGKNIRKTCNINFIGKPINDIAVYEEYTFDESDNDLTYEKFENILSKIFYEDLDGVGKQNVYKSFLNLIKNEKHSNKTEIINHLSNEYKISNNPSIYEECIEIIERFTYNYIIGNKKIKKIDKNCIKKVMEEFLFQPKSRNKQKQQIEKMFQIKCLLDFKISTKENNKYHGINYFKSLIDYLNTLGYDIKKEFEDYEMIKKIIQLNSETFLIINRLWTEKENIFNCINKRFERFSSDNLIEVLKQYYKSSSVKDRHDKIKKLGINNPDYALDKAIQSLRNNISENNMTLSDYINLNNKKQYFTYKK